MAIAQLQGKQILITGAASGIGRASAMAFAREGAHIIASDLQLDALRSLREEIHALGVQCHIYTVDVSNEAAMRAFC